jgi:hypothetical protein
MNSRTLFRVLIEQRGWDEYHVFKSRFDRAARELAQSEGPRSLATVTIERRQFVRYLNGQIRAPQRATRRVLEHLFGGISAERLLQDADDTDVVTSGNVSGRIEIEDTLMAAAEESARFAARAEASNVGPHTLEQLESDVRRIIEAYPSRPVDASFVDVRVLRDRAFEFLEGRQPPAYTRDLYLAAGVLCGVLANACFDLGNFRAAETQARTAFLCGELAGHNGLRSWVRGTQALTAYYDGRPGDTVRLADDATRFVPEHGTAAVRAHSIRARALAQFGDADAVTDALDSAATALDNAKDSTMFTGKLAFPYPKHLFYAASAHVWLGGADHAGTAARLAGEAVDLLEQAPPVARRLGEVGLARLELASARLGLADADGAAEALHGVAAITAVRPLEAVTRRMNRFGRQLAAHPALTSRAGVVMRELVAAGQERHARAVGPA